MPRAKSISAVNGIFDTLTVKSINNGDFNLGNSKNEFPYSLVVATTESLPEEGECFKTSSYIPFHFKVNAVTLQVNQRVDHTSKVNVKISNRDFEFTIVPSQTTVNKNCTIELPKGVVQNVQIENMSNDDGDVSTCTVLLHGFAHY